MTRAVSLRACIEKLYHLMVEREAIEAAIRKTFIDGLACLPCTGEILKTNEPAPAEVASLAGSPVTGEIIESQQTAGVTGPLGESIVRAENEAASGDALANRSCGPVRPVGEPTVAGGPPSHRMDAPVLDAGTSANVGESAGRPAPGPQDPVPNETHRGATPSKDGAKVMRIEPSMSGSVAASGDAVRDASAMPLDVVAAPYPKGGSMPARRPLLPSAFAVNPDAAGRFPGVEGDEDDKRTDMGGEYSRSDREGAGGPGKEGDDLPPRRPARDPEGAQEDAGAGEADEVASPTPELEGAGVISAPSSADRGIPISADEENAARKLMGRDGISIEVKAAPGSVFDRLGQVLEHVAPGRVERHAVGADGEWPEIPARLDRRVRA